MRASHRPTRRRAASVLSSLLPTSKPGFAPVAIAESALREQDAYSRDWGALNVLGEDRQLVTAFEPARSKAHPKGYGCPQGAPEGSEVAPAGVDARPSPASRSEQTRFRACAPVFVNADGGLRRSRRCAWSLPGAVTEMERHSLPAARVRRRRRRASWYGTIASPPGDHYRKLAAHEMLAKCRHGIRPWLTRHYRAARREVPAAGSTPRAEAAACAAPDLIRTGAVSFGHAQLALMAANGFSATSSVGSRRT